MITLGVRDLAASRDFYANGLGFPQMESPPEVAFFTLNGSWLALYGRTELAEDATVSAEGTGFSGFALAHNVSSEREVDEVLGAAAACGATVVKPAAKTSWGGYSGYFADPDGFLWEVAHNPLFWVGPWWRTRASGLRSRIFRSSAATLGIRFARFRSSGAGA
jgi:uncharacterized protein